MRASRRLKVFQPAELRTADGPVRIHLLDVSHTGILGHAQLPPWPGERVELDAAGLAALATVRWRNGRRFGLEFERPLTDPQLTHLTRQGARLEPA